MLLGLSIISYLTIVLSSVSTFTLIILHIQITTGKKWKRCGDCSGCMATDCSLCKFCYDKPKFGGEERKSNHALRENASILSVILSVLLWSRTLTSQVNSSIRI